MVVYGTVLFIIQRSVAVLLFKSIRFLLLLAQNILWYFDGTTRKSKATFNPENFGSCVRVLNIKAFHTFDVSMTINLGNFVYTQNRFESPQYIHDNDHISLITITPDYAIFGEAKDKGMELWRSQYSPFIRFAQTDNCNKLLLVPMYAFNRMSEASEIKCELVFLFNVGRCGSTLLTQMMEYTGKCVAVAEPEPLKLLARWYRKTGSSEEVRCATRSCVRWICRPYHNFKPMAYVVKISGTAAGLIHLLKELYPNSRYLFMYRDMLTVSKSIYRLSRELPLIALTMILGRVHKSAAETITNLSGLDGKQFRYRFVDDLTFGLVMYIGIAKIYLEFYNERLLNIGAIRYEDIISDPIHSMREILKHCNLPQILAELAVTGMAQDSQRNSPLSQRKLQRHRNPDLTPTGRQMINILASKHGIPTLEEDSLLPGTITTKPKFPNGHSH